MIFRPAVLVVAALLSARTFWLALTGQQSLVNALIWFLVAIPVAAIIVGGLSWVLRSYRRVEEPEPQTDKRL